MSDAMNSHATAIKQAARDLAQGNIWATDRHIETIDHHADDLDAARVAAEARADAEHARAERWKRLAEGWEDDFREQMMEAPSVFVEKTIQQMRNEHLHPDDLDAEPGDTAGERRAPAKPARRLTT